MAENDTFYAPLSSVVFDTQPSLGQITDASGMGGFTYVPNYHAYGTDSFTYHDVDQYGQSSNEATVTIYVTENAPVASDVDYTVLHDNVLTVPPNGVLSNSSDIDSADMGYLTAVLVSGPTEGTLSDYVDEGGTDHPLLVDGSFAFTPPPKWAGTVTFQFNVSDGILSSASPATATIDVTDEAPVAGDPGPYYVAACEVDESPNTLTVDAPGVLDGASDVDGDKMIAQLESGPSSGELNLNPDGSFTYTPKAGFSGVDSFAVVFSDGIKQSDPKTVKVYSVKGDLQAATIQNNGASGILDNGVEETEGAFVPIDNVDQNYDGTADMLEDGPIAGEKDLLPITLKAVEPAAAAGSYSLTIPDDVIVYQNPDKTGQIGSGMTFATANDTKLYVEGIGVGSGMLILNWTNGTDDLQTDKVKITVFDWEGPQNVPGTGIYLYTASGADAGSNSQWLSPVGGTWIASATSDMQYVQWSPGPTVGQAVYQASSNYTWDRDVNVVAVTIGATNNITYVNPPVQGNLGQIAAAPPGSQAMVANVTLNIEGPVVGGEMRGVRYMQAGFIQNVTVTQQHGVFSGFTPPEERVSSLEGNSYLDASGGSQPWQSPDSYISGLSDIGYQNEPLSTVDTPLVGCSDDCVLSGGGKTDIPIDAAAIVLDFQSYIAARTTDSENGADFFYVQIAVANWQFNGSGTFAGADTFNYGTWTSTENDGEGNTGAASFSVITSGATVPITSGITANDASKSKAWSTEPPFSQ